MLSCLLVPLYGLATLPSSICVTPLYCPFKKITWSKGIYSPTHKQAKILDPPYMVARAVRG